jgi:hypothetical protein
MPKLRNSEEIESKRFNFLAQDQGDPIGRFFAYWAIFYVQVF